MANENLKNFLALAKEADNIVKTSVPKERVAPMMKNNMVESMPTINRDNFDEKIAELNEQVFGKYKKPEGEYSAEEEMERIKKRNAEIASGKVSNPILQEVLNNPYDMDINMVLGDANPKRTQLEEKLSKKYGGLEQAKKISQTLEESDKQKSMEKTSVENVKVVNEIDYSLIENIIERVIENKLNRIVENKPILNESANKRSPMIIIGDNLTFVDSDGNMYKCNDMKYIGKMKVKSR